jgi:hypothetical protein
MGHSPPLFCPFACASALMAKMRLLMRLLMRTLMRALMRVPSPAAARARSGRELIRRKLCRPLRLGRNEARCVTQGWLGAVSRGWSSA